MCTMWVLGGHQSKLSNSVNKLLAKSVHFLFLTTRHASRSPGSRSISPSENSISRSSECVGISSNMTQVSKPRTKNRIQENSIKLQLEASDKFMEIKVLWKSVVCLARCQITRGCTILHSNQLLQKSQQRCLTSPKTTLQEIQSVLCIQEEIRNTLAITVQKKKE